MPGASLRVGIDLVQISRIAESLERFGERFLRRVFTDAEVAYSTASASETASRLAARFAAKEAAIKALGLVDQPMNWRDIEVSRAPSGACEMTLRGSASTAARIKGVSELAVSLSHEGDYATAVVIARLKDLPRA
jgi:holo-[acyl-carrier protein] synthase